MGHNGTSAVYIQMRWEHNEPSANCVDPDEMGQYGTSVNSVDPDGWLIMDQLICIYTVCHSVLDFDMDFFFERWLCRKLKMEESTS